MEKVTSKDGTSISYQASGRGKPLVLVHGTSATAARWAPVLPALEKHFRVTAVNRRGRSQSGDADSYAIERECEDIAAVVDSFREPVHLLGHSYGAICSLEAARLTSNIDRLLLYEPPLPSPGLAPHPPGVYERINDLLEKGDREAVVTTFMLEVVEMPPHELEIFRSSPAFPARVAAAHTLPRELKAQGAYVFEVAHFKDFMTPTLLLLGEDSPTIFHRATRELDNALPNSRVAVLPGQQHIAIDTAPQLFAREVLAFLGEPG